MLSENCKMAINDSIDHEDETETRDEISQDLDKRAPTLKKQLTIERSYSVEVTNQQLYYSTAGHLSSFIISNL